MAFVLVPAHVNETTEPVDHLGGVLSIALVGALILGINFAAVPNETALIIGLFAVAAAALGAFFIRQRRAKNPLYDLTPRPPDLLGSGLCRDHRLRLADGRDVHRAAVPPERASTYSTVQAGLAILPAAAFMVVVAPALGAARRGARRPLHAAARLRVRLSGLSDDARPLEENISYWKVALGYSFVGIGVGLAGTPASHSLTGRCPSSGSGWLRAPPTCSATWAERSCSRSSAHS
jgi:hypothetical protein